MRRYQTRRSLLCHSLRSPVGVALAVGLALYQPLALLAQHAVNRQLNTELYGRGVGTMRRAGLAGARNSPWHQPALPSEARNAAFLSGRLPSEFRGAYLARGPISPGGVMDYITSAPTPLSMSWPHGGSRPVATVGPQVNQLPAVRPQAFGFTSRVAPAPARVPSQRVSPTSSASAANLYSPGHTLRYSSVGAVPGGAASTARSPARAGGSPAGAAGSAYGSLRHAGGGGGSQRSGLVIPPVAPQPASMPSDSGKSKSR